MIKIIADTHTHTLACDHAYSTITENAAAAVQKDLSFICITEHGPAMPGAPGNGFFQNMWVIPREMNGVTIIKGAEANIMNKEGALDLSDSTLAKLEWVIASMHIPVFAPFDRDANTQAWLAVAGNPNVDVIGHCGDGRYPFDEDIVLRAFKEHGKIVEINAHSFSVRPGSAENCMRIAKACIELEMPIVVSSDAHFHNNVGEFTRALELLESIQYPRELILNADCDRFLKVVKGLEPQ